MCQKRNKNILSFLLTLTFIFGEGIYLRLAQVAVEDTPGWDLETEDLVS